MNFIPHIISHIKEHEDCRQLKDYLYLFPSKRAAGWFQQLLQKSFEKEAFILPKVQTIQEFFVENSDIMVADDYMLLQELYGIHEAVSGTQQPFHQFISWGKLVLKDFDEIDKYLVDTDYFFKVLLAHKEVEAHFNINDVASEYLSIFYDNIRNDKQGIFFDDFIQTWKYLGEIYTRLGNELLSKNRAYEGKVYRILLDKIKKGSKKLDYTKIIFCGFNAFATCEESLLDTLINQYDVETWWDVDNRFMTNPYHEAGNFLRHYHKKYSGKNHHWIDTVAEDKKIEIVALPTNVGQVHYVQQQIDTSQKNCIVLCDENLLDYCLPIFDLEKVNITMGLGLRKSAVFEALVHYTNIIANSSYNQQHLYLNIEDMLSFFSQNLFNEYITDKKNLYAVFYSEVEKIAAENIKPFIADRLFSLLTEPFHPATVFYNLLEITKLIHAKTDTDKIILQEIRKNIEHIAAATRNNILQHPKDVLAVLQTFVGSQSIAFETDRNNDTQIMGFLETRLQDFENIYITSLNDAILPGTNKTNSFIPYHLRKSFRLPTFDQFDGINAYHFYRLLKRGKNICLVYNNSSIENEEEKSRFIKQIEFELDAKQITHKQMIIYNNDDKKINTDIEVQKTEAIVEQLKNIEYSPSSLKTYINCPIQFYLKYILKVYEPEELYVTKGSANFGNVLHRILELYYTEHPQITTQLIDIQIENYLVQAVEDLGLPPNYFSGKNALNKKIIQKIAMEMLLKDAKTPFEIIGLEITLSAQINTGGVDIALKGKADRIDQTADCVRIIDYKTGSVRLASFPKEDSETAVEIFFDKIFGIDNANYPETFQGMLYAWLYHKANPETPIAVGFFLAKKLQEGIHFLNDGKPISAFMLQKFEQRLSDLLSEILNIEIPFTINPESKSYEYSAYADLLGV